MSHLINRIVSNFKPSQIQGAYEPRQLARENRAESGGVRNVATEETANIHLLLVEDEPRYLARLTKRLTKLGYQHIMSAQSAAEASKLLNEHHFDVIVADMRLERDHSGFEIVDEVRQRHLSSIVIILTANDTIADCRKALKGKGAWDYIPKLMTNGSAIQALHDSIQEAITYFNHWGNTKDEKWISKNEAYLRDKYFGKYVAVLNQAVIESSDSRAQLERRIQERKLPLFLTVIKKIEVPSRSDAFKKLTIFLENSTIDVPLEGPLSAKLTIFCEGPTDVAYINKAAAMLGQEELLAEVHLDTIGDPTGQISSGWKPMAQGFNFLKHNSGLRPNKVLFLCDQDVKETQLPNKGRDFETLFVRRIDNYSSDQKGIEWLFDKDIFEEGFQKGLVEKDLGRATISNPSPEPTYVIKDGNKVKFCRWICNERQNKPQDFKGFEKIFEIIAQILAA